jgi:hypothetical protein
MQPRTPMPTAEAIFATYLLPLYPADAAADLEAARTTDANPGKNPSLLSHLEDAARVFVAMHARVLGEDLGLDFSDASVHRLGAALGRDVRDRLAREGAPGTAESALFNVIVHGAAYVGECVVRAHGGAWLVRRPLWESRVRLVSRAGDAEIAPLSLWLRSLADDAFDDAGRSRAGLAERYRTYVEVPTTDPASLEPIAAPRALPRLKKPRYDVFYKYLRAHVPELRDVGADFPSPERFDAYRFAWLDFFLVGGGRMLLVCGPGEGGLHAFWLERSGFAKSALFAADATPEPTVRVEGDKIVLEVFVAGEKRVHEVLWWGP